jgi:hypothetical protein
MESDSHDASHVIKAITIIIVDARHLPTSIRSASSLPARIAELRGKKISWSAELLISGRGGNTDPTVSEAEQTHIEGHVR